MSPALISLLLLQQAAKPTNAAPAQQPSPAQPVVDRLVKFISGVHSMSAEFALTSNRVQGNGTAKLDYSRPGRLNYTMKWGELGYRFVGNDHGCWDANYTSKTYDESQLWGFNYPESEISNATFLFPPGFLMDGTLMDEGMPKVRYVGSSTINGVKVDGLQGASDTSKTTLYIDPNGQPIRYVSEHRNGVKIQADMKSMVINKPEPNTLFPLNPPSGFNMRSLPLFEIPIPIGTKFPTTGWNGGRGTTIASLISQKPTLVVFTNQGCEPSAKSAATVSRIAGSGSVNIAVATLSANASVPAGLSRYPVFYTGSLKMARTINAPGTPFFVLVGKDGKVAKLWYGFDPDKSAAFQKDVLASLHPSAS